MKHYADVVDKIEAAMSQYETQSDTTILTLATNVATVLGKEVEVNV